MKKTILLALLAFAVAASADETTYVWNPTTVTDKNYWWQTKENWLVNGATANDYPNSASAIVEVSSGKSLYSATGKCKEFRYTNVNSFPIVNQGAVKLVSGGKMWWTSFPSTSDATVTWYAGITCGDSGETGEVEVDVPSHMHLRLQKGVSGPCTLVKTGLGTLTDAYEVTNPSKDTKRSFSVPKVLLKEGTLNIWANTLCNGLELVFDGASDDLRVGYGAAATNVLNLTIKSGAIRESALAEGTAHGFTTYSTNVREIVFTGAPKVNPMRFTGRFYNNAGICWNPDSAETPYVFEYAKSVSDTTGQLIVSNGIVRLTESASFTALSRLEVSGGTLQVDAAAGLGFHADLLEVGSVGAKLDLGKGVVIACTAAKLGDEALDDGVYTSANAAWITGEGCVEVGEVAPVESVLTLSEGDSYAFATNSTYAGVALTTAGDFTFGAAAGAALTLGGQGLVATGASAARTVTIDCPVLIEGTQTWRFSSKDKVVINGSVMSARSGGIWQISGAKTVEIRGANVYSHTLSVSNAAAHIYGTAAMGGDIGQVLCEVLSGGRLYFHGVTTGKGIRFWREGTTKPGTMTIANFYASEDGLVTTNRFGGYCEIQFNGNQYFNISKDVTAHFRGGVFKNGGLFGPRGDGTMLVTDKTLTPARLSQDDSTTLILAVADNPFGGNAAQIGSNAKVVTAVPYAIRAYSDSGSVRARLSYNGTIDLMGNDQSVASLSGAGKVTSETPAFLHLVDKDTPGSVDGGTTSQVTRITFNGGAGFSKDGTLTNWIYAASASTGTVQVTNGCLVFTAKDGSPLALMKGTYPRPETNIGWTQAAKAVVAGGRMVLEHSKAFGKDVAFELNAAGKLELGEGVRQRCATLSLDGETVKAGIYGSTESTADIKDDEHFSGTGVLKVGTLGGVVILR